MKTLTRREFLKAGAIVGAGILVPSKWNAGTSWAFAQSDGLKKFIQPLRGNNVVSLVNDIGVAAPDTAPAPITGVIHYTVNLEQFTDQLHPQLVNGTTLWGFKPTNYLAATPGSPKHLGGIVVAQKGVPIQITFVNKLPTSHIIPVDTTIMGAGQAQNRAAIHLHGGFVPWISDGGPFNWFEPAPPLGTGAVGESFLNNAVLNPGAPLGQAEYYYPNDQSARFVWYHDHAWGITRINAYAGIASGYIIRDGFETALVANNGLPGFIENGGREIPIIIQDKIFVSSTTARTDPTWFTLRPNSRVGDLWYAHVYEPELYTLKGNRKGRGSAPNPSAVPEFFGDTMLANGTVYPEATVEARRYRLRILNACNARFLNLQLYVDDGSTDGITLDSETLTPMNEPYSPSAVTGLAPFSCLQIGTEGGFLPKPANVPLNAPFNPVTLAGSLILGPAERADVIIDFTGYAGRKLILYNDAPAPFPDGDAINDYFPGNQDNPVHPEPGFGPNTRQIMRLKVVAATALDPGLGISTSTDFTSGIDPLLVAQTPGVPTPVPLSIGGVPVTVRRLTLNETFDEFGRLLQLEGTDIPLVNRGRGFGRAYTDPATEVIKQNAIEVWEIANLTGDTHPIHFHLVNVQVLSRQPFRITNYNGTPSFFGSPVAPDLNELGWKDTVRMNPGEVTRVIARFTLPTVPFTVPTTPRNSASVNQPGLGLTLLPGQKAHEYVWHCHILEHEEHDMMRPLVVIA